MMNYRNEEVFKYSFRFWFRLSLHSSSYDQRTVSFISSF